MLVKTWEFSLTAKCIKVRNITAPAKEAKYRYDAIGIILCPIFPIFTIQGGILSVPVGDVEVNHLAKGTKFIAIENEQKKATAAKTTYN
jgi:hypothetical protein